VRACSREVARAEVVCERVKLLVPGAKITAWAPSTDAELLQAMDGAQLVVSAGAARTLLAPAAVMEAATSLRVAIDLNAVPPNGLEGVDVRDRRTTRGRLLSYGALGVGRLKMRIHKAVIQRMFERNDGVFDADAVLEIGAELDP
jgi:hypothetical protein